MMSFATLCHNPTSATAISHSVSAQRDFSLSLSLILFSLRLPTPRHWSTLPPVSLTASHVRQVCPGTVHMCICICQSIFSPLHQQRVVDHKVDRLWFCCRPTCR